MTTLHNEPNLGSLANSAKQRQAKASAAFRLAAAPFDPVAIVVDTIAESDDPTHVLTCVDFLARRENYPDAVTRIESVLVPSAKSGTQDGGQRLVKVILGRGVFGNARTFRVGVDLGFVSPRDANTNVGRPVLCIGDLIEAATAGSPDFEKAFVALAALGFVRSPRGIVPIESASAECPCLWPATPAERLALALNLIVRVALAGERFDSIRLVRS